MKLCISNFSKWVAQRANKVWSHLREPRIKNFIMMFVYLAYSMFAALHLVLTPYLEKLEGRVSFLEITTLIAVVCGAAGAMSLWTKTVWLEKSVIYFLWADILSYNVLVLSSDLVTTMGKLSITSLTIVLSLSFLARYVDISFYERYLQGVEAGEFPWKQRQ